MFNEATKEQKMNQTQQVVAEIESLNAQVVTKILGRDVTRGELNAAFTKVESKDNWKKPIDARIILRNDFELLTVAEAVEFFTGSKATITPVAIITSNGKPTGETKYRVKADGYYKAIGA